jgi:hypothetical protein
MFAFFINDELQGFWSNNVGDLFFDATCKGMSWDKSKATLVRFDNLKDHELQLTEASVQEASVFREEDEEVEVEIPASEENPEPQTIIQRRKIKVLDRKIPATIFAKDGLIIIPC